MPKPTGNNDRLIAAAAYGLTMLITFPLLSIAVAWLFLYLINGQSLFVEKHLKQNFNLIVSIHIYILVLTIFIFLVTNMGGLLGWITETVPLLGITLALGGFFSFFLIIIILISIAAVFIVLMVYALFGQWVRLPLIIRFVK